MVDKQEGHVVYVAGEESMVAPLAGFSAAEVASKHAARGFFDSLRAEVARDNVRVTLVHPQGRDGGSSSTSHETPQRLDPTLGHDQSPQQPVSPEERPLQDLFLEHDRLARKMLIAAAKGRDEVVIPYNRRRSLLDWVGFGEARRRNLLKTLRGLRG
ncbi:unnamed protein product [Sphacelaria rigidula]